MKQEGIIKGTAYGLSGQILNAILSYIRVILLTTILFPEEFGLFSLVFSMVSLATAFSTLGIDYGAGILLPRNLKNIRKSRDIISTTYTFNVLFVIVTYFIASIVSFLAFRQHLYLLLIALLYIISQLGDTFSHVFTSYRYMQIRFFNNLLKSVSLTVFSVLFALKFGVIGALFGFSLTAILYAVSTFISARSFANIKFSLSIKKPLLKTLLSLGFVIFAINYIQTLLQRFDVIFLAYFRSVTEVGFYTIGASLSSIAVFLPSAIGVIFFPYLSELDSEGRVAEIRNVSTKILRIGFFFLIPIVMFGVVFSSEILTLFFRPDYLPAHVPFALLLLATPFMLLSVPYIYILTTRKRLKILGMATMFTGLFNAALNLLWIPVYGMAGAAVSTVLATFLNVLFVRPHANREIKTRPPIYSLSVLSFSGIAVGALLSQLKGIFSNPWLDIIVLVLLGGGLYAGLALLLRGIKLDELLEIFKNLGPLSKARKENKT